MTNEQINAKIAELCGWTPYPPITNDGWPSLMIPPNSPKKEGWVEYIPNCAADLNACHELEKTLHHINEWFYYEKALAEIADGYIFHATARQRCEAFLRVHGQWEETDAD